MHTAAQEITSMCYQLYMPKSQVLSQQCCGLGLKQSKTGVIQALYVHVILLIKGASPFHQQNSILHLDAHSLNIHSQYFTMLPSFNQTDIQVLYRRQRYSQKKLSSN